MPILNGNLIVIRREFYIIDDLRVNAFIGVDILKPEGFIIDFSNGTAIIETYEKTKIKICAIIDNNRIFTKVYNKNKIKMPAKSIMKIIIYKPKKNA